MTSAKKPLKNTSDFWKGGETHYIKSASFGGKFTLLRESVISGTETKQEWEEKMLRSVDTTMSSGSSSSEENSWAKKTSVTFGYEKDGKSGNKQKGEGEDEVDHQGEKDEKLDSTSDAAREEVQMTKDEIIVEGGHQQIAAILSDKNRAGFKAEFKEWLNSIPDYPKGYDFKFGELPELLDMNFGQLIESMGEKKACWKRKDLDKDGYYLETIKDEKGDNKKVKRRCQFENTEDFIEQMTKRRLSLKRAIAIYADNKGQTGTDLTLPAGLPNCEGRQSEEKKEIDYQLLTNGDSYLVKFKLQSPIGDKIATDDMFTISFQHEKGTNNGRWMVSYGYEPDAGQMSKLMQSQGTDIVQIKGVDFNLVPDASATTLEWNQAICKKNAKRFEIGGKNISCSEDGRDSVDWLDTPLAVVKSIKAPDSFLPCNVKWSNLHMLYDDNSCVRFTAASAGPIYFVLSAIPASDDTWYYFRITNEEITAYKGDKKLKWETHASGAVGLGASNLFQSFVVCSEYSTERTKLSFSKIKADEVPTRSAKINTYLQIVDRDNNIQPSFYSFGSGEEKVQIVDIEQIGDASDLDITCAGDTQEGKGGNCVSQCKISDLLDKSNVREEDLSCTQRSDTSARVDAGGVCSFSCTGSKVKSWSEQIECGFDGDWKIPKTSLPLQCLATCNGDIFLKGKLRDQEKLRDLEITTEEVWARHCKAASKVEPNLFVEGMKCTFGTTEDEMCDTTAICGKDSSGIIYQQRGPQVECNADGQWASACDSELVITEPICAAQPCLSLDLEKMTTSVAEISFSEDKISDMFNEGSRATVSKCPEHHVPLPLHKESVCKSGSWTVELKCTLREKSCSITDLKAKAETIPRFGDIDLRCPGAKKQDSTNIFGGGSCPFECIAPYRPSNELICQDATWMGAECVRDGGWSSWKCPMGTGRFPFRVCDNPKPDRGNDCDGQNQLTCDECSTNWTPLNTGCYNFIKTSLKTSWQFAKHRCERIRGRLVEINTKEENQLIQERGKPADIPENDWQHLWLGMTRGDGNNWNLLSGKQATFFNWHPTQLEQGPASKCALMVISTDVDVHGTWWDQDNCNTNKISSGDFFDVKNIACEVGEAPYRFLKSPLSWDQAQAECKKMGWQLVEINSKEKNDAVLLEAEKRRESLTHWIGLRFKPESSTSNQSPRWAWDSGDQLSFSTGDQLTFSNWRTGQPDNFGGKEHCADMRDGLWNDAACSTKHPAICEKQESLFIQILSTRYDAECTGGDNCCSDSEPCDLHEGDCDKDSHCKGELKCGHNNCGDGYGFDPTDDCCVASAARPADGTVTNDCLCGEKGDPLVFNPDGPEKRSHTADNATIDENIVNGQETNEGEFPWQAYIYIMAGGRAPHAGGGVIISPSHILTAAHVVTEKFTNHRRHGTFKVYVGGTDTTNMPKFAAVKDVYIHPDYVWNHDLKTLRFDVAIIELEEPLEFSSLVKPICLPSPSTESQSYDGKKGWISGWGAIGFTKNTVKDLLKAVVVMANDDFCKNEYEPSHIEISESMTCTLFSDNGGAACRGDSGGPLVLKDHDSGRYFLVGIVSFGVECGRGKPGVYARVRQQKIMKWIRDRVNQRTADDKKSIYSSNCERLNDIE